MSGLSAASESEPIAHMEETLGWSFYVTSWDCEGEKMRRGDWPAHTGPEELTQASVLWAVAGVACSDTSRLPLIFSLHSP